MVLALKPPGDRLHTGDEEFSVVSGFVARAYGYWARKVMVEAKPLAEPEAAFGKPTPMTGFWASLSDEQKRRALEYDGPQDHGDPEFLQKA